MDRKIKVLYFVDRMLRGGIQSFLIDYISHMDLQKIDVSILVLDDGCRYELEDQVEALGISFYKLKGVWVKKPSDLPIYLKAIDDFFAQHHDYDIVHMNSSSKNVFFLQKAKKYGIPVRIAHSHNTGFQSHKASEVMVGNLLKSPLRKVATHYFACSEAAGTWMFGKHNMQSGRVQIIKNAIDIEQFRFDAEKRNQMREELGVQNLFVVGNVGRLSPQKNHKFLLRIFKEVHKKCPGSCLLLVGEGPLRNELEEMTADLGLSDCVRFLGFREDRDALFQAMDVFVFPSLYEGLGIAAVEAQASGLPCIVSDTVPHELFITDLVLPVPLSSKPQEWENQLMKFQNRNNRKDTIQSLKGSGYDIVDSTKRLENFYFDIVSVTGREYDTKITNRNYI